MTGIIILWLLSTVAVLGSELRTYACDQGDTPRGQEWAWVPPPCDQPVYVWKPTGGKWKWATSEAYDEWHRWKGIAKDAALNNVTQLEGSHVLVPLDPESFTQNQWMEVLDLCAKDGHDCDLDPLMRSLHQLNVFARYCTWCVEDPWNDECNKKECSRLLRRRAAVKAEMAQHRRVMHALVSK